MGEKIEVAKLYFRIAVIEAFVFYAADFYREIGGSRHIFGGIVDIHAIVGGVGEYAVYHFEVSERARYMEIVCRSADYPFLLSFRRRHIEIQQLPILLRAVHPEPEAFRRPYIDVSESLVFVGNKIEHVAVVIGMLGAKIISLFDSPIISAVLKWQRTVFGESHSYFETWSMDESLI